MVHDALIELAAASADQPIEVDGALVTALIDDARAHVHELLRVLADSSQDAELLLDPHFTMAGDELYLDRHAALSVKLAVGGGDTFATVACRTLLINLAGGDLMVECFEVDELRARRTDTLKIAPGHAIACVDARRGYRFFAPADVALVGKRQFERERPVCDYHHVFALVGEQAEYQAEYQATIPFDFGAHHAAYCLGMAGSLGHLESVLARHRDKLLAGPTPFLWEAAKLFVRARDPVCYRFLDALIARGDANFDSAARMTRDNLAEVIPRAH